MDDIKEKLMPESYMCAWKMIFGGLVISVVFYYDVMLLDFLKTDSCC